MFEWPVMPLCEKQLRDVNPRDVLCSGLYRRCDIYKGGGGYDKFEAIYQDRMKSTERLNEQFVVQLRGCPLRCPYCYVTAEGIWDGTPVKVPTDSMVCAFTLTGFPVFHLMGGAPALYIEHWPELLSQLPDWAVFHSDLLLVEKPYPTETLKALARDKKSLYAVSIKGSTPEEFQVNTGVALNEQLLWANLDALCEEGVQFYLTFTGMSPESIERFKECVVQRYGSGCDVLNGSFGIDLVHYKALD